MKNRMITEDQFGQGQICFEDLKVCHCEELTVENHQLEIDVGVLENKNKTLNSDLAEITGLARNHGWEPTRKLSIIAQG